MRASFHPDQSCRKTTQNSLCMGRDSAAWFLGVQNQQLLPESQIFEEEVLSGPENADDTADEVAESRNHGEILSEHCRCAPFKVVHFTSARGFDEAQGEGCAGRSTSSLALNKVTHNSSPNGDN